MKIEFDPTKDAANAARHGVSLAEAQRIEWNLLVAHTDDRKDYREVRMVGYAPIGERLYCVVFTDRGETRRIISLRKANAREVKKYAGHY
ncbi:MAG: BrnT family toxin [Rudaea sp.]|uniref:BrnT family toxin n=1 Tax=Rudaea sp. TaxID=2136325 RepID=UPI0039E32DEE